MGPDVAWGRANGALTSTWCSAAAAATGERPDHLLYAERTVKDLPSGQYLPDLMHDFVVDFITRHKEQPFYVYYAMSHIHGPIVRTLLAR